MEINVLVNGILDRIGAATARNVLRMADMRLIPMSIASCGEYRKASVNQVKIGLIDPSEVHDGLVSSSALIGHGRPDVVVDFNPNSFFGHAIPDFLNAKTSFVLVVKNDFKEYATRLSKMIKNLGVNIALLPENSSEAQILSAIRYLHQKNEANIFGQVIGLEELVA